MKNGAYKNQTGAILHVTGPFMGSGRVRTLGGIYTAEARDDLFGTTTYLVTKDGMLQSGYELIEEETR